MIIVAGAKDGCNNYYSYYNQLSLHSPERPWNESLSSKIAEVQESFKNIPSMLYFSPSSVSFDGIGVYTAEALPKGAAHETFG